VAVDWAENEMAERHWKHSPDGTSFFLTAAPSLRLSASFPFFTFRTFGPIRAVSAIVSK
jgi:hypothetical protein